MNTSIDMYKYTSKPQYCYDKPHMDAYGALVTIAIWAYIFKWIIGFANIKPLNFEKTYTERTLELNKKVEDLTAETVHLVHQNEALDENLRFAEEKLRLAEEKLQLELNANAARTALVNSLHNSMVSFANMIPPEHDTQG